MPITAPLAERLKAAAAGRAPTRRCCTAPTARPGGTSRAAITRNMRAAVEAIGEDPDLVTPYSLRHSNITRMLLRNVPVRLIASFHDTSIGQIERNYSRFITEAHSDAVSRSALLPEPAPAADDNVVRMAR